jgi:hypothetical protein
MQRSRAPTESGNKPLFLGCTTVSEWLDCLRSSFAVLAQRVREQIAVIVGSVVSDAVRHTVHSFLDRDADQPAPFTRPQDHEDDDVWGEPSSNQSHYAHHSYEATVSDDEGGSKTHVPGRLMTAVVAAWKAASWWARRRHQQKPRWTSVVIGAAVGAAAYFLNPLAAVAGTALTAVALADSFVSGSSALTGLLSG